MTLAELQQFVDQWVSQRGGYWTPLSQYVRLVEEVGELGRELNHRYGDKPRLAKDKPQSVADELADILFIVVLLANDLGVQLETATQEVLRKYEARRSG
jgi:NTP pyrophosphatase (non-canonical NTP hydrolase)